MPIIPKTQLTEAHGTVPNYARQQMIPANWNAGNSIGSGIAKGVEGIADAGYKIAGIYAKKQREQEEANRELQDASDRMIVQKLQTDYTLATSSYLQQASENPGDYSRMDMNAQNNIADLLASQQDDFDRIQNVAYRQTLENWRAIEGNRYLLKVHDIANQGMISEYRAQVATSVDDLCSAGEYDAAESMLSEVKQGVFRPDELKNMREQVGTKRTVAAVRSDASWGSAGPEETLDILRDRDLCRDYYGDMPDKVRDGLISECTQMISSRSSEVLDDLNNELVVDGKKITDQEILDFVQDPANNVPKSIAPKLVSIVKNVNAADGKETKAVHKDDKGNEHAFEEIYASDMALCQRGWARDLMKRGEEVEKAKEILFEKYSKMGRLKEYGVLLKTIEANAYPDLSVRNDPLVWYFRKNYGGFKEGFKGRKIKGGFFESYDPKNDGIRGIIYNSRGNDDDIVEMNQRLFEAEMMRYITTTPNISEDDIDTHATEMRKHFNLTCVDMIVVCNLRRMALANPIFDNKYVPAGE